MAKTSCHKTSFVTPFGQFQFTVMPFGLSGAPSPFQQMMDSLIKDKRDFAAAYLDDLVIFSSTYMGESHAPPQNNSTTALQSQPHSEATEMAAWNGRVCLS